MSLLNRVRPTRFRPATMSSVVGSLRTQLAVERPDLLAPPVSAGLTAGADILVVEIDPAYADTAAFCAEYGVAPEQSANCVIVSARRAADSRMVACVVLATTRADVNGLVRRHVGARKASFAAMDDAVAQTGMEYGGITPVGLPADWPLLVDSAVVATPYVVVGSGRRRSKLVLPGAALAALPGAEVLDGLGIPSGHTIG